MNSRIWRPALRLGVLAAVAGAADVEGQTLTARSSTLNYNYVYGAGADSHAGDDLVPDASLLLSDVEGTGFSGSTSGVLTNGQPYSAGVFGDLHHEYSVGGTIAQFQSISASASTRVSAATSGAGVALMYAVNPGNGLILNFTVADPVDFDLSGTITIPEPSAFSFVALQFFDGIVWQNGIFNSIFLPGGQGDFHVSGTLAPGSYRLNSALALRANGGEDWTGTYGYRFVVPEPAGLGVLLIGGLMIRRLRQANGCPRSASSAAAVP